MNSQKTLFVVGVAAALFARSAMAACPAGYISKAGHCIPGRAPTTHAPLTATPVAVAPSAVSPVPGGKAALNPQPIPPGHNLHKTPAPPAPPASTPSGQDLHWDLKAQKEG